MRSFADLLTRLTVGGLLMGHGGQKLFGWYGGSGIEGTADWLGSMELRPATAWAGMAGASELAGGLLTALGFLNPIGPLSGIASMSMAWAKVHRGRPIWVTAGGAELPATNIALLAGLALAGPGRLSLDSLLGTGLSRRAGIAALGAVLAGLWMGAGRELEDEAEALARGRRAGSGRDLPEVNGSAEPRGESADQAVSEADA